MCKWNGKTLNKEGNRHDNRIRCIPDRLESSSPKIDDRRSLDRARSANAYKLPGAADCNVYSPDICEGAIRSYSAAEVRRHINSSLHQQPRRHNILRHSGSSLDRNVHTIAQHLLYQAADAEAYKMRDFMNWKLSPVVFRRIDRLLGPIEVDFFASRITRQCPIYYSWLPDPYAAATDVFLQDWSHSKGFANQPWRLIGRVL